MTNRFRTTRLCVSQETKQTKGRGEWFLSALHRNAGSDLQVRVSASAGLGRRKFYMLAACSVVVCVMENGVSLYRVASQKR